MEDMGLRFRFAYEVFDRPPPMERIIAWATACRAARELEGAKVGQMGYGDMRQFGTMFDGVSLRTRIGVEVEFFEMLEMVQRVDRAAKPDIDAVVARMKREWEFRITRGPLRAGEGRALLPRRARHHAGARIPRRVADRRGRHEEAARLPSRPDLLAAVRGSGGVHRARERNPRRVMSQHYFLVYGDATAEIDELCRLLGIGVLR